MRFELRTLSPEGRIGPLRCHAADATQARAQAELRGHAVLEVASPAAWQRWLGAAEPRFALREFCEGLRLLLEAGLPLAEALEALAGNEASEAQRQTLEGLCRALRQGQPFSSALQGAPAAFPAPFVAAMRASEHTSDLPRSLARYAAYDAQLERVRQRARDAALYPTVLAAAGALVGLFLLFYVVPRFGRIYEERAAQLPLYAQALLGWGRLVEAHAGGMLIALAGGLLAAALALRQAGVRAMLAAQLLRLPALAGRVREFHLARLYRTAGMLLQGGVPLVGALRLAGGVLPAALRARLEAAADAISEGRSLSTCLQAQGLATPVGLRLLLVGERSGAPGDAMERIATFHDEALARWLERASRLLEPLLMAAMGLAIGTLVVLMYLPVFELAGQLR